MSVSSIRHLAYLLNCKTTESELLRICDCLNDRSFKNDEEFYREIKDVKTLKNSKLKTRILHPSTGRLKLIQGRIKKNILELIRFPPYITGGLKGHSNISNAHYHLGNKFKFTCDIKSFFPSIKPSHIYNAFLEQKFKPDIARILTILCTYKGKLPQGAPMSSHLANLVFLPLDYQIQNYCNKNDIKYSRYIDDITLSSKNDFKDQLPEILELIKSLGFKISSRKTQYKHVLDITGITTSNNILKPNKAFYERLQSEINPFSRASRLNYEQRVKNKKI